MENASVFPIVVYVIGRFLLHILTRVDDNVLYVF